MDVFLSYKSQDRDGARGLVEALEARGLEVWFDADRIEAFDPITKEIREGLARAKVLVAWYSDSYAASRPCQWELTTAYLAAQRHGDPVQRVLLVNLEEGVEHIQPEMLRDQHLGDAGDPAALAEKIAERVAAAKEALGDVRPTDATPWHGAWKGLGSERWVGRLPQLWKLHELLTGSENVIITGATPKPAQVTGMGGQGKSLLAEEYALRFGPAYPGGVFWLRAYGHDDAKGGLDAAQRGAERDGQIRQFAIALGLEVEGVAADAIRAGVGGAIRERGQPCLWIVDDLPSGVDRDGLNAWLAPDPLARTLITTRTREHDGRVPGLALDVLDPREGFELLTRRRQPKGEDEVAAAHGIVEDLGRHALAVDVTGGYLKKMAGFKSFAEVRAELAERDADPDLVARFEKDELPNGHETSVVKTIMRSVEQVSEAGRDFLLLASELAVAPIRGRLVARSFERCDSLEEGEAVDRAVAAMSDVLELSLGESPAEGEGFCSVHTLVSRVVRFREEWAERRAELRAAVVPVLAETLTAAADIRRHADIQSEVGHARLLAAAAETAGDGTLLLRLGRHDYERGDYPNARRLGQEALEVRRRVLGAEHRDTLTSMNNLAGTLWAQGDLAGARELQETVLETLRRVLGAEHPDTLTSMNNLASTLRAQGDLAGARELQETVLETLRRVLGAEHPDTLTSMNNLAETLRAQGGLAGARELQETVLETLRRVLGAEHPDTLTSMNNLAETLRAQGGLAGARELQETVLETLRRVLGAEHPATLTSMSNLAETLRAQGDLAGARELQGTVLETRRRVLGAEHPDTLRSTNNLALTLRAQGDLAGAHKLQEEALELRRRVLGAEHPETSGSAWNLLQTVLDLGEHDRAQEIERQDLIWLLDRDPAGLGADQRKIREMLAEMLKG